MPALPTMLMQFVSNPDALITLFRKLSDVQTGILCKALHKNFPAPFYVHSTLTSTLHLMRPSQKHMLLEQLHEELLSLRFKNYPKLRALLVNAGIENYSLILEGIAPQLPYTLKNSKDLMDLLSHLTPEDRLFILRHMRDKLPHLITNLSELAELLSGLDTKGQYRVLDIMGNHLHKLVKSGSDLETLLAPLKDKSAIVLEAILEQLPLLVDNLCHANSTADAVWGLRTVLPLLNPTQCDYFLKNLWSFPRLFPETFDVIFTLKNLSIENGKLFMAHLRHLEAEGKMKHLPALWTDYMAIAFSLKGYSLEQCQIFFDSLGNQSKISRSKDAFSNLMDFAGFELRPSLLKILGPECLQRFKEGNKLLTLLNTLPKAKSDALFESIYEEMVSMGRGTYQHGTAFKSLSTDERAIVFGVILDMLVPFILLSKDDFIHTFQALPASLCRN